MAKFWVFWFDGIIEGCCCFICYWLFRRKMELIMVNLKDLRHINKSMGTQNTTTHSQSPCSIPMESNLTLEDHQTPSIDLQSMTKTTTIPTEPPTFGLHSRSSSLSEIRHNVQYDYQLAYVTRKYQILAWIAVLTTIILIICTFPMGSVMGIANIDSILNSWFIVLFDAKYNYIYVKLCGWIPFAKTEWNEIGGNDNNKNKDSRRQSQVIIKNVINNKKNIELDMKSDDDDNMTVPDHVSMGKHNDNTMSGKSEKNEHCEENQKQEA